MVQEDWQERRDLSGLERMKTNYLYFSTNRRRKVQHMQPEDACAGEGIHGEAADAGVGDEAGRGCDSDSGDEEY